MSKEGVFLFLVLAFITWLTWNYSPIGLSNRINNLQDYNVKMEETRKADDQWICEQRSNDGSVVNKCYRK